jgi:hypothetical protein
MSFTFKPAQMDGVGLFGAIAGPSRSGKTFTALTIARGIAGPYGKIAAIDTEGKRMSHYKDQFLGADGAPFDVHNMQSPFTAERFAEGAKAAEDAKYACLVVDSFSLEWAGAGGVLQRFDEYFEARGHNDKMKDICWSLAKKAHNRMLDDLTQRTIPIIFCLRAGEVARHLAGGVEGRWKVVQDKKFLYEWTFALTLLPDTPGMLGYDVLDAKGKPLYKVQDQHRHLFPEGKLITSDAGAALQAWRMTDAARASTSVDRTPPPPTPDEIAEILVDRFGETESLDHHNAIANDDLAKKQIAWMEAKHPELWTKVNAASRASLAKHGSIGFGTASKTDTAESA